MKDIKIPQGGVPTYDLTNGFGGPRMKVLFPNGWAGSVISGPGSYTGGGKPYELAVFDPNGGLNYKHPVSQGDVRGWLDADGVAKLLQEIADTTEDQTKLWS